MNAERPRTSHTNSDAGAAAVHLDFFCSACHSMEPGAGGVLAVAVCVAARPLGPAARCPFHEIIQSDLASSLISQRVSCPPIAEKSKGVLATLLKSIVLLPILYVVRN